MKKETEKQSFILPKQQQLSRFAPLFPSAAAKAASASEASPAALLCQCIRRAECLCLLFKTRSTAACWGECSLSPPACYITLRGGGGGCIEAETLAARFVWPTRLLLVSLTDGAVTHDGSLPPQAAALAGPMATCLVPWLERRAGAGHAPI